jgi:hypothetical protein
MRGLLFDLRPPPRSWRRSPALAAGAVTSLAVLQPRRAAGVDPMRSLRAE